MRLCFIVEERYRQDGMPLAVADQLTRWGHDVDLLEPQRTGTCLTELAAGGRQPYDAWVLKTVSDGPRLSILEAAAAGGMVTINDSRAIRLVRDKAVAAAWARVHGLPFPPTYFVTHRGLLEQIPRAEYPLVVKPSNGCQGRSVRLLRTPEGQIPDAAAVVARSILRIAQRAMARRRRYDLPGRAVARHDVRTA